MTRMTNVISDTYPSIQFITDIPNPNLKLNH